MLLEEKQVLCPYCGEPVITTIDPSAGNQEYTEDCSVCCQPIVFTIAFDMEGNLIGCDTRQENE